MRATADQPHAEKHQGHPVESQTGFPAAWAGTLPVRGLLVQQHQPAQSAAADVQHRPQIQHLPPDSQQIEQCRQDGKSGAQ